jgi:CMP-N-acetylneuraminic acid synthetase
MHEAYMGKVMINNKKVLAIIPARAGSKRVKSKNLRDLGGKPLIAWTIEAAKKSKYIDHIFVSTDSEKIQTIAKELSVSAEPLRKDELSGDHATSTDVVLDIIQNIKTDYDLILLIQPTSPLRNVSDIDGAIELYFEKNAKSVVSVCETEAPLSWCGEIGDDLNLDPIINNLEQKRSQDIRKTFMLNGAVYISDRSHFIENKTFYIKNETYSFVMSRKRSIDIDTEEDFLLGISLIESSNID